MCRCQTNKWLRERREEEEGDWTQNKKLTTWFDHQHQPSAPHHCQCPCRKYPCSIDVSHCNCWCILAQWPARQCRIVTPQNPVTHASPPLPPCHVSRVTQVSRVTCMQCMSRWVSPCPPERYWICSAVLDYLCRYLSRLSIQVCTLRHLSPGWISGISRYIVLPPARWIDTGHRDTGLYL